MGEVEKWESGDAGEVPSKESERSCVSKPSRGSIVRSLFDRSSACNDLHSIRPSTDTSES